jgi:uncharacterized protein with HEPN domain
LSVTATLTRSTEVAQLALARLLIVGEASGKVSTTLRDVHPEIPWAAIGGLRNRLVHAYFDVDLDVLMDIASKHLPQLIAQLEALLQDGEPA